MDTQSIVVPRIPHQTVSAVAGLRSATWPAHQRLEKRLDVHARFSLLDRYRNHLQQMWGFCAALESRLGHEAFRGALVDYESRRKLPALTRDLLALGASHASVSMLPRCSLVPECRDPAAAFGCVYVLEGATLGGRVLLPLVRSRLGLTEQSGASFLASYGEDIGPKWRTFGAALDAWCSGPRRRACAEQSAVATFQALEAWLCETQP